MTTALRRRLLCCAASAVLAATPARAHAQASPTPTGEPEVLKVNGAITEVGVLTRAEYRIDIPANWNHSLVVFYHGYTESPFRFRLDGSIGSQPEQMFKRGFAVIQSGYSETGWALQAGYADTEALRRYFVKKYGPASGNLRRWRFHGWRAHHDHHGAQPRGQKQVHLRRRPQPLRSRRSQLRPSQPPLRHPRRLRLLLPGLMGPIDPVPADFQESDVLRARVLAALKSKPEAALAMRELTLLHSDVEVAREIGYFTYVIGDLQRKAGGNPFDNRNWLYTGTSIDTHTDYALNDGVHRYAPDPKARDYLMQHYWPNGRLTRPMVALHTIYDPLIPANTLTVYASEVAHAGFADNLVQQYVHREGHCTFTPEEVGKAFDELLTWTHTGHAPSAGFLDVPRTRHHPRAQAWPAMLRRLR